MIDSLMRSTGKSFGERLKVYRNIVDKLVKTGHLEMGNVKKIFAKNPGGPKDAVAITTTDLKKTNSSTGEILGENRPGMSKDQRIIFDRKKQRKT